MKREQAAVVQLHTRRQIDSSKLESVSQRYEQLHQKIENQVYVEHKGYINAHKDIFQRMQAKL